jgi:hypothetical protein
MLGGDFPKVTVSPWLPTWLPKNSLAALMFEWPHTVSPAGVLRFLSRHGAVGADVMPLNPEACEDR